jgi:DNA replication protein DnaC
VTTLSPTDHEPIWQTHRALDAESECVDGTFHFDDQDGPIWSVICSGCGQRFGLRRADIEPRYRVEHLLRISRLPARFLEKTFDKHVDNWSAMQAAQACLDGWPDGPRPPMLVGAPGVGKTHLLVRTARRLIVEHDVTVRFATFADLMDEAKRAMDSPGASSQEIFDDAAAVPLLVLDDLGAGLGSDWSLNMLEALVDRRYRSTLPILGSTNVAPSRWRDVFGDRVASRLHELCAPVEHRGEDRRLSAASVPVRSVVGEKTK